MSTRKAFFILAVFIFSISALVVSVLAEETASVPAPVVPAAQAADQAAAPAVRSDTQWVWGEVVSMDAQAKSLTLKYLDYEADQEKNIVLDTDGNTTYENIKSIDEIKAKDVLSVDYVILGGKNIAKNISLEKLDAVMPEATNVESASPEPAPSVASQDQAVLPVAVSSGSQPVAQNPEVNAEVPAKESGALPAPVVSGNVDQAAQNSAPVVSDAQTTADPAGK